jgi:hypothetical protein
MLFPSFQSSSFRFLEMLQDGALQGNEEASFSRQFMG